MNTLLESIKSFLKDGQVYQLKEIVAGSRNAFPTDSNSAYYISIYHELREHPELFERVGRGLYKMQTASAPANGLDSEEIRDVIRDILKRNPGQTVTQVWRRLQKKGVFITYKATHHLLQSDLFDKNKVSQYSNL